MEAKAEELRKRRDKLTEMEEMARSVEGELEPVGS
jgi:hypothetical protein